MFFLEFRVAPSLCSSGFMVRAFTIRVSDTFIATSIAHSAAAKSSPPSRAADAPLVGNSVSFILIILLSEWACSARFSVMDGASILPTPSVFRVAIYGSFSVFILCILARGTSSPFPSIGRPGSARFREGVGPVPVEPAAVVVFLVFLLSDVSFDFRLILSSVVRSIVVFNMVPGLSWAVSSAEFICQAGSLSVCVLVSTVVVPLFSALLGVVSRSLVIVLFYGEEFFGTISEFVSIYFVATLLCTSSSISVSLARFYFSSVSMLGSSATFFAKAAVRRVVGTPGAELVVFFMLPSMAGI